MTPIDFYILPSVPPGASPDNRPLFVCRLADKLYAQGHRVYIHSESQPQALQLDDLLWTFTTGFLPHELYDAASIPGSPIQIGCDSDANLAVNDDGLDVLINMHPEVPLFFSRFGRVAEIVGFEEAHKQSGRLRFRFYRDRGYPLESHTI